VAVVVVDELTCSGGNVVVVVTSSAPSRIDAAGGAGDGKGAATTTTGVEEVVFVIVFFSKASLSAAGPVILSAWVGSTMVSVTLVRFTNGRSGSNVVVSSSSNGHAQSFAITVVFSVVDVSSAAPDCLESLIEICSLAGDASCKLICKSDVCSQNLPSTSDSKLRACSKR